MLISKNNYSMLGCFNNRQQQLKKLAKSITLKLSQQNKIKSREQNAVTLQAPKRLWGINNKKSE